MESSRKNNFLLRLLMLKMKITSGHINVLLKFSLCLQSDPATRAAGWTRAECIVSLSVLGSTCKSVLLWIMIAYQDVDDISTSLSWCRSSCDLLGRSALHISDSCDGPTRTCRVCCAMAISTGAEWSVCLPRLRCRGVGSKATGVTRLTLERTAV